MKDRAVVLCPRWPWPLDDGGRIGLWQTVWAAAQEFETTLLCMVPPGTEADPIPEPLQALGIEIHRIPHAPPPFPVAALRGLVGRWPYTLTRFRSATFARTVAALATEQKPSHFFVNHLHLAMYWDSMHEIPMILREHNLEYLWMDRYAAGQEQGPKRWYSSLQVRRLRKAEAELCGRSAVVLAISVEEAEAIRRLAPSACVEVLPIGIDCPAYGPPSPVDPPVVLLAGAFDWPPNAEGAIRFVRDGWSLVKNRFPQTRLRIAGRMPPKELVDAASAVGAEITGYVKDMKQEFRLASAIVVPLWVGAGARVKIVEALASGLPIVSTRLGAEGLGLASGADYLAGETTLELAEAVVRILDSASTRAHLQANGARIALQRFSLPTVGARQNEFCRRFGRAGESH